MVLEDTPTVVMAVVIAMIVFGAGVFAFYVTTEELGTYGDNTEYFNVENPHLDQVCTLEYEPVSKPTVWQYNGFEWLLVNPTYVSYAGNIATISHSGLQG